MQINWLELKNKKTGFTIKHTAFGKVNCLVSETPETPGMLLDTLEALRNFAIGSDPDTFLDIIVRVNFHAAHNEYLWYVKTTAGQGLTNHNGNSAEGPLTIVDEEELYNAENRIVAGRSFKTPAVEGYERLPEIVLDKSIVNLLGLPETEQVRTAFRHVYRYQLTDKTAADCLAQAAQLPHGAAVLLDGAQLTGAVDLTRLTAQRDDLQFFAAGCRCDGVPAVKISFKNNAITCKAGQ